MAPALIQKLMSLASFAMAAGPSGARLFQAIRRITTQPRVLEKFLSRPEHAERALNTVASALEALITEDDGKDVSNGSISGQ